MSTSNPMLSNATEFINVYTHHICGTELFRCWKDQKKERKNEFMLPYLTYLLQYMAFNYIILTPQRTRCPLPYKI